MEKNKETVFITGGAGFLGSYVARKFIDKGYNIIAYDAFSQYVNPIQHPQSPKHLKYRFEGIIDSVIFVRGDTRDKSFIQKTILEYKPSIIIHLAALPLADEGDKNPEEAISTINTGTVNILDIIKETNFIKRFVYTSSSMIYGDFKYSPADENHPKKPKGIYGGAKLAGEILTESYARRYDIPYSIIRPSAVYGPGDINHRVVQVFLENAFENKSIKLHNGGVSKLDFSFVEDVADGFILTALSQKAEGETFNITRGEGRQLKELAQIIQELFDRPLKIESTPPDMHRPERGALSIEKAQKLLEYNPKYSLEEGVKKYYKFLKTVYEEKNSSV